MSRDTVVLDPKTSVAYGKDHVLGYFVQIYTNGEHDQANCQCTQCVYDEPEFWKDYLPGWDGVIEFVREHTGRDITGHIVGVP